MSYKETDDHEWCEKEIALLRNQNTRLVALLREAREALADYHYIGTLTTRIDAEIGETP